MDELYEYLKDKIKEINGEGTFGLFIDTAHAFRLFHLVCFMKQIRGVINQEDDMWNTLRKLKEERE